MYKIDKTQFLYRYSYRSILVPALFLHHPGSIVMSQILSACPLRPLVSEYGSSLMLLPPTEKVDLLLFENMIFRDVWVGEEAALASDLITAQK